MRDFPDITARTLISTVRESLGSAGVEVEGLVGIFVQYSFYPKVNALHTDLSLTRRYHVLNPNSL